MNEHAARVRTVLDNLILYDNNKHVPNAPVLEAEYKIYIESTRTEFRIRESADVPGLTDILQIEEDGQKIRITLRDEDLPVLIEALQRRIKDVTNV